MPCGPLKRCKFCFRNWQCYKRCIIDVYVAIGTVPLMLTFGALSSLLSKGYTKKILKFSGVLIIVLGLIMSNRGLALAGINLSPTAVMARLGHLVMTNSLEFSSNAAKATIQRWCTDFKYDCKSAQWLYPNTLMYKKVCLFKWVVDGEADYWL